MGTFWSKYKGYLIHGAAVAVIFLVPSVQHFLGSHPAYAAPGAIIWGFILHWANGQK